MLVAIAVEEGQTVPVGTQIATIDAAGSAPAVRPTRESTAESRPQAAAPAAPPGNKPTAETRQQSGAPASAAVMERANTGGETDDDVHPRTSPVVKSRPEIIGIPIAPK